jgi:hypothetical protein
MAIFGKNIIKLLLPINTKFFEGTGENTPVFFFVFGLTGNKKV